MASNESASGSDSGGRVVWVDTDGGIDDAAALMLLFGQRDVTCKGVSCVFGNKDVEQVGKNVTRILQLCGKAGTVPLYRGASASEVFGGGPEPDLSNNKWYGEDGMGDVPGGADVATEALFASGEAAEKLVEAAQNSGEGRKLTLVALGPLTNIAQAMERAPEFPRWIEKLVVAGGATEAGTHFNFRMDPAAAQYVFEHWKSSGGSQILLLPKELGASHKMPLAQWQEWDKVAVPASDKARFLKAMFQRYVLPGSDLKEQQSLGNLSDVLVMAAALFPTKFIADKSDGVEERVGTLPDAKLNVEVVPPSALKSNEVWEAFLTSVWPVAGTE